jgi:hypothetical protein
MFRSLRDNWHSIRGGKAGSRFQDHHQRSSSRARSHRAWGIAFGLLLMVAGAILSIPPGVPGFILVLIGAAVVSSRSSWAARKFDGIERWMRRMIRKIRGK